MRLWIEDIMFVNLFIRTTLWKQALSRSQNTFVLLDSCEEPTAAPCACARATPAISVRWFSEELHLQFHFVFVLLSLKQRIVEILQNVTLSVFTYHLLVYSGTLINSGDAKPFHRGHWWSWTSDLLSYVIVEPSAPFFSPVWIRENPKPVQTCAPIKWWVRANLWSHL